MLLPLIAVTATASACREPTPNPAPALSPHVPHEESIPHVRPELETRLRYTELAQDARVAHTYRNGEEADHRAILESLGGGVALLDYDADGRLDLLFPGGGEFGEQQSIRGLPAAIYRQLNDWSFDDVTAHASLGDPLFYSHGVSAADSDGDGFRDVLITGYGGLLLLRNNGDGTFTESAHPAGLTDHLWSSSSAWGDINGDGDLDLYVAHYVDWSFTNHPRCPGPGPDDREICSPKSFSPLPDLQYFSNGDGTFRDATAEVGLRPDGKGLGVLITDLDVDGDVDVYVSNDTVANFLYRNDGEGRLLDESLISGSSLSNRGTPDGSMGVDTGDYNLDGLPDIWVANYEQESFALYRNEGQCFFQHVSQATGVMAVGGHFVGWGTAFVDVDRDGDEDIVASNGHVIRYPQVASLRQTPLLLENRDGKNFINVAPAAGGYFAAPHMGRGLAAGDLDNDGGPDLVVSCTNEPVGLLKNESAEEHSWVGFRLIGVHSHRDCIGATLTVTSDDGRRQLRQVKGGGSYASTADRRLLFGLGRSSGPVRVEIRWPCGIEQSLPEVPLNQYVDLIEPLHR